MWHAKKNKRMSCQGLIIDSAESQVQRAILKNLYFIRTESKNKKITEEKSKVPNITGGKALLTLNNLSKLTITQPEFLKDNTLKNVYTSYRLKQVTLKLYKTQFVHPNESVIWLTGTT